ncbi:MAG TPA: cobalamin B12-binding domain-containing protein [Halanaerobiales bacterium]|nr:cobalamin B12-binding domain-containing protein [Halanaerobiales bacterium]
MKRLIIGASVGNCVHVAGVLNFLRLAEEHGYRTKFLGPAVSIDYLLDAVQEVDPDMIAVGYRLTPETGYNILKRLKNSAEERGLNSYRYVFGGTLPVARVASRVGLFDAVFSGVEEVEEIIAFLEGKEATKKDMNPGDELLSRMEFRKPYPLIRHHFGLPTVKDTKEGIKEIAENKVLDIISLGPDQNAQEAFFRPEEMDEGEKGAGGVPVRSEEDLKRLFTASRCGNYPLMRSYSGTRDVFKMAKMLIKTINNAWCAVPLSWYNELDGRGPRKLLQGIKENQQLMKWHGERGVPVEVNESHHWSLRDAHDTIAVVMAYLAAYNARKMGVDIYISQYMLNTPSNTSAVMDLAKMIAKKEMIMSLQNSKFKILTQVRAGLSSFPVNINKAKGQLAYATFLGMELDPDIVHVVAFSEADHAAKPSDIIESCLISRQLINNLIYDRPSFEVDPDIIKRKNNLIKEAEVLLNAMKNMADIEVNDPWNNPSTLTNAIKIGLLDAPHLKGNPAAAGNLTTRMIDGACYAYDYNQERIISEEERIERIIKENRL